MRRCTLEGYDGELFCHSMNSNLDGITIILETPKGNLMKVNEEDMALLTFIDPPEGMCKCEKCGLWCVDNNLGFCNKCWGSMSKEEKDEAFVKEIGF